MYKKILSLSVIVCFLLTTLGPYPQAHADGLTGSLLNLPQPGTMVNLSPAYEPALIKGITVHKDNPFLFDFILDTGHSGLTGNDLKKEGDRLVKYFFACLTIPEKDLWVNLSPYEKDRMAPQALGQTALGRDLLAEDYILKQLTASLIYPEKDLGKAFWERVYTKARQMYGTTQIPVNTFNKVWILADKASVYEHGQTAFVVDGHLKVMLEEDYLALSRHSGHPVILSEAKDLNKLKDSSATPQNDSHSITSNIIRTIILPEIEKEVNTGKNFSTLRQIFNSLILASWYKKNLKDALLNQVYADKSTINGIKRPNGGVIARSEATKQSQQDLSPVQVYDQYIKAYKKGVFNYIKEDIQPNGQSIPKKYFSGGFNVSPAMLSVITDQMTGYQEKVARAIQDLELGSAFNLAVRIMTSPMTPWNRYSLTIAHRNKISDIKKYLLQLNEQGKKWKRISSPGIRSRSQAWTIFKFGDKLVHVPGRGSMVSADIAIANLGDRLVPTTKIDLTGLEFTMAKDEDMPNDEIIHPGVVYIQDSLQPLVNIPNMEIGSRFVVPGGILYRLATSNQKKDINRAKKIWNDLLQMILDEWSKGIWIQDGRRLINGGINKEDRVQQFDLGEFTLDNVGHFNVPVEINRIKGLVLGDLVDSGINLKSSKEFYSYARRQSDKLLSIENLQSIWGTRINERKSAKDITLPLNAAMTSMPSLADLGDNFPNYTPVIRRTLTEAFEKINRRFGSKVYRASVHYNSSVAKNTAMIFSDVDALTIIHDLNPQEQREAQSILNEELSRHYILAGSGNDLWLSARDLKYFGGIVSIRRSPWRDIERVYEALHDDFVVFDTHSYDVKSVPVYGSKEIREAVEDHAFMFGDLHSANPDKRKVREKLFREWAKGNVPQETIWRIHSNIFSGNPQLNTIVVEGLEQEKIQELMEAGYLKKESIEKHQGILYTIYRAMWTDYEFLVKDDNNAMISEVSPEKIIMVAGTFDDNGGAPSALIGQIHDGLPKGVTLINGGYFSQIPELIRNLDRYDVVMWFPNVPNDKEKLRNIKDLYPNKIVITSKRNHEGQYSLKDIADHALKLKSNLVIEFSDTPPFNMRLIDPLANIFENTKGPTALAKSMMRRLAVILASKRQNTRLINRQTAVVLENPQFFDLVQRKAAIFHQLMNARSESPSDTTEHPHFRCERGFPSMRQENFVYVSKRDFSEGEDFVTKTDMVEVDFKHFVETGKIQYSGPFKPSVDTPIQVRLYKQFPKVKYIMHSHEYVDGAPFTKEVNASEALQEYDEIIKVIGKNQELTDVAVNLRGHGSVVLASDLQYLDNVKYVLRTPIEEATKLNAIMVGGTFNQDGGIPSSVISDLYASFPEGVVLRNGGSRDDLEKIMGEIGGYDVVMWFPQLTLHGEEITRLIKQRYPYKTLVAGIFNPRGKYSFQDMMNMALGVRCNLFVEFSSGEQPRMRLYDPLSNQFSDTTSVSTLAEAVTKRLEALYKFTRQGSTSIGQAVAIPNNETFQQFLDLVRNYGEQFHDLIHPAEGVNRFLGNTSFRASHLYSDPALARLIYISKRNIDKRNIDENGFAAINMDSYANPRIEYFGEQKPSVDTPTQVRFFDKLPNVNYILHAHVYIDGAPFTRELIPCGSIEEVEEVFRLIGHDYTKSNFAVNLLGHGSIIFAHDLEYLGKSVKYKARSVPEPLSLEGRPLSFAETNPQVTLVTSQGGKVVRQAVEDALLKNKYFSQVHLVGTGKRHITALVVPNMGELTSYAKQRGIYYVRDVDLVNHPEIQDILWNGIEEINQTLGTNERIHRIGILRSPFTAESRELDASGRGSYSIIEESRQEIIGDLYKEDNKKLKAIVEVSSSTQKQAAIEETLHQSSLEIAQPGYFESDEFAKEIADLHFPGVELTDNILKIFRHEFKSGRAEHYSHLLGLKGSGEAMYESMEKLFQGNSDIKVYRVMFNKKVAGRVVLNEKTKTLIDAIIFEPYRGNYLGDVLIQILKEKFGDFTVVIPAGVPIYNFFIKCGFKVLQSESVGPVDLNIISYGDVSPENLQSVSKLFTAIYANYANALLEDLSNGVGEPEESALYKTFPHVYDLLYQRFSKRLPDYLDLVRKNTPIGGTILDSAAGTGEVSVPLLQDGFRVLSADLNRGMLDQLEEKAKSKGVKANTLVADFLSLGKRDDQFDTVTVRQAINYLIGEDKLRQGFEGFHKLLKPGGSLVFNAPNYDPERFSPPVKGPEQITMGSTHAVVWERNSIDANHVLTHHQQALVWDESNRREVRYYHDVNTFQMYTKAQFEKALREAGFSDIEFLSSQGRPYDPKDPVIYVIAKASTKKAQERSFMADPFIQELIKDLKESPFIEEHDSNKRDSAVILLLRKIKGNWHVLLIKRSPNMLFPGIWALPGGGKEKGETLKSIALREFNEEMGFPLEESNLIGAMKHEDTQTNNYRIFPFVAVADETDSLDLDQFNHAEIQDAAWVPLDQIIEGTFTLANGKGKVNLADGPATYRILNRFIKHFELAQDRSNAAMSAVKSILVHADKRMNIPGGIDLNTSNDMKWKVSKDGRGVDMDVDPGMIERVRREGINWLSPVIFKITPVTSIWPLVGFQRAPSRDESLAGA